MATNADYLPYVLPYAPTCADFAAQNYIREALIEFCYKSLSFQVVSDPETVVKNNGEIELDLPNGTQLVKIMSVNFNGQDLTPIDIEQADQYVRDWHNAKGNPLYYAMYDQDFMRLLPIPEQSSRNALIYRIAVAPSRDATESPDYIFNRYARDIANGALSKLLMEPSQAYSDANKAVLYQKMFEQACSKASAERQRSFAQARHRVRGYFY